MQLQQMGQLAAAHADAGGGVRHCTIARRALVHSLKDMQQEGTERLLVSLCSKILCHLAVDIAEQRGGRHRPPGDF